jgi:TonB family protein
VARDGSVKDIVVTNSEPARTFDAAAVAAMRRYRYRPVMQNGAAVEQRAYLRIRFTAKDGR